MRGALPNTLPGLLRVPALLTALNDEWRGDQQAVRRFAVDGLIRGALEFIPAPPPLSTVMTVIDADRIRLEVRRDQQKYPGSCAWSWVTPERCTSFHTSAAVAPHRCMQPLGHTDGECQCFCKAQPEGMNRMTVEDARRRREAV